MMVNPRFHLLEPGAQSWCPEWLRAYSHLGAFRCGDAVDERDNRDNRTKEYQEHSSTTARAPGLSAQQHVSSIVGLVAKDHDHGRARPAPQAKMSQKSGRHSPSPATIKLSSMGPRKGEIGKTAYHRSILRAYGVLMEEEHILNESQSNRRACPRSRPAEPAWSSRRETSEQGYILG
ncbi:hypothetical protein CNMCM5623_001888 [Aspergillus felis]|uniref:Uncharacterized protein n=1 Tax=Aspergillus felis TaxID=1287682 RepID=A0A8H6QBK4_9EURO|nr:hypothetical protein CNMCM5623_001888 [Aspergillus felis]